MDRSLDSSKAPLNPQSSSTSENTSLHGCQKSNKKCPYKYVVIAACFFNVMFSLGVNRSLIIFLKNVQDTFLVSEKMKVMFIVFPMIFGGLCSPVAAFLCKKYTTRIVCSILSFLGTISWLLAIFLGSFDEADESIDASARRKKFWSFIICVGSAGLFHGGVLVNAPIEVNRWVEPHERTFWNAMVWTGSSVGALWIGPTFSFASTDVFDGEWMKSLLVLACVQGFVLLLTSLLLREPTNSYLFDQNRAQQCTFRNLWSYRLFRWYLGMQICYGLWRAGTTVYLVNYAEQRGLPKLLAATLITVWAVFEFIARPTVGRLGDKYNRYTMIGTLFLLQAAFTMSLTQVQEYFGFAVVIALIGAVQGGAGGLFMTAVIDAVGVDYARYAYSMENFLDVFVAGMATQAYGQIGDRFFATEMLQERIYHMHPENGTIYDIEFIEQDEPKDADLRYVFVISGCCMLLASTVSFVAARIPAAEDSQKHVVESPEINAKFLPVDTSASESPASPSLPSYESSDLTKQSPILSTESIVLESC